ncbi:ATP-dependent helicase [Vibrio parahaemolyticus]
MTVETLLHELNDDQRKAACLHNQHALVLAGAGTGKTKTIVSRAAYLIANGTPANRIHILTFTRRAASEIVERVKMHLEDDAQELKASTFHTWCMSLIHKAPNLFNRKGYSVIDRDDQLQLFKLLRGKVDKSELPLAGEICDLYSYARNTDVSLQEAIKSKSPDFSHKQEELKKIMLSYESRKNERKYLDYDDIIDVVAQTITTSEKTRSWVAAQYDHLLVDEMQDTNPLQWRLLEPLMDSLTLFCVGDDAQSIYGFRGADFRNVHNFTSKVSGSIVLKLQDNYRSTQEILDVSNWLLTKSTLSYDKKLCAVNGSGNKPELHTFHDEWEEGRWVVDDIVRKRSDGLDWKEHMILVRSSYSGRVVEKSLIAKEIPYKFIGGVKLLESAHIRDLLSVLRIVANKNDEIAWMRFLSFWKGIGEVKANKIVENCLYLNDINMVVDFLRNDSVMPVESIEAIKAVLNNKNNVANAIEGAFDAMKVRFSEIYSKKNWDNRKKDIIVVKNLSEKHTNILDFIEDYILNPINITEVDEGKDDDLVTLITIHSAKGAESKICYVINVSTGAFPSKRSVGNIEDIEEERRVLYVALTRAMNELIITRCKLSTWAISQQSLGNDLHELYFLNDIPQELFNETYHQDNTLGNVNENGTKTKPVHVGIKMDEEENAEQIKRLEGINNKIKSDGIDLDFLIKSLSEPEYDQDNVDKVIGDFYEDDKESVLDKINFNNDEEIKAMTKKKISVERNEQMEEYCKLTIDSCTAYLDEENVLSVIGVVKQSKNKPTNDSKEVNILVYDCHGDIMAKNYDWWGEFGIMQSFSLSIDLSEFENPLGKVVVYPSER